jgi:lysozyme
MIPLNVPRMSHSDLMQIPEFAAIDRDEFPVVFGGISGYYRDSMGVPGVNDRMIYDDAIYVDSPTATVFFNGNTDPNGYRKGIGKGAGKGMATLVPGWWPCYKFDLHKGKYLALCQRAGPVTVLRDGDPPYEDTGWHGINIHSGSQNGTSSLGCQTIPPSQWDTFIALAVSEAKRYSTRWKAQTYGYLLSDAKK